MRRNATAQGLHPSASSRRGHAGAARKATGTGSESVVCETACELERAKQPRGLRDGEDVGRDELGGGASAQSAEMSRCALADDEAEERGVGQLACAPLHDRSGEDELRFARGKDG